MFGMDILYCPREIAIKDGIFNEEVVGEFNDAYLIEAYMENFDGFQGGGDILTKLPAKAPLELLISTEKLFPTL